MKFTDRTISILTNFVSIYPSLSFKKGTVIDTISASKSIIAKAHITEELPQDFCVYDLSKFLATLSLFSNPEIEFEDKFCTIQSGKSKVKYYFADPRLILTPPERAITLPTTDVELELSSESLKSVEKARKTLGLSDIAFIGDGETLSITALDASGAIADKYSVDVGETDKTFRAVFKADNLKLIEGTYDVDISAKGIAAFTSEDMKYFILLESASSEFK